MEKGRDGRRGPGRWLTGGRKDGEEEEKKDSVEEEERWKRRVLDGGYLSGEVKETLMAGGGGGMDRPDRSDSQTEQTEQTSSSSSSSSFSLFKVPPSSCNCTLVFFPFWFFSSISSRQATGTSRASFVFSRLSSLPPPLTTKHRQLTNHQPPRHPQPPSHSRLTRKKTKGQQEN
ncbi:hypothetical protein TRV_02952 [Trichophyton verrucosum HKI 0517]|uniref:Uncharacterized protein n=1 Tax=Trichophyton verrucosum (strain HKI 0517) TaxID=663202 RepID=D4D772_TRIVH|nr:uncharacterized protein TRV_02952 [Trichophyton verrucosum HKI 0517]EFE42346.1 hypothetical protein TRV_02952 [Trichophyton verrucosum HKI 0517]